MIQENINNLISLWQVAGLSMKSYTETESFNFVFVKNSEWPNKLWFDHNIDYDSLKMAKDFLLSKHLNLSIPYWDIYNTDSKGFFEKLGFSLKSQQVGMSIKLKSKFEFQKRLVINLVTEEKDAQTWEEIYPDSFGYKISKDIVMRTQGKIKFYLAMLDSIPVGTAIVYNTGNVTGIHGVGVIPSARRKGYADEIMKHVINDSIDAGMKYSTLQASDMGKGIYLRLGYSEDFVIRNYILGSQDKQQN